MSIHEKEQQHRREALTQGKPPPIAYGFKHYKPSKVVLLGGPQPRPIALHVFCEGDSTPYGSTAYEDSPDAVLNGKRWRHRKLAPLRRDTGF